MNKVSVNGRAEGGNKIPDMKPGDLAVVLFPAYLMGQVLFRGGGDRVYQLSNGDFYCDLTHKYCVWNERVRILKKGETVTLEVQ